jgi:general secretion pathway protein L
MSETLVIRLSAAARTAAMNVQWLLVDTHGARLGAVLQGSLAEAAGLASGRKVIVLVPGADALHLEPVLPPLKGNTRLAQIVPFALEDQLATDVDALHFAVGKRGARPGTPVTVVSHDAMQRWIFALREAGLQADALYTDSSLLPVMPDGVTVLIDQTRVTVRQDNEPATTLDVTPLSEALHLLLPATDQPVTIYVAEVEYDAEQQTIEAVRERAANLQIKLLPDGVLPLLALQAAQGGSINLLQGVYTPRTNLRNDLHAWRYAAGLLAGLFAVHLFAKGIELWQLRKQEAALDQQLTLTYSQGLPGAAPVAPAQARQAFESRWTQLQAGGSASGLMSSLNVLSQAMSKNAGMQLEAVSYRNDNVDLRITAPSVDALEQIRQQAQASGITAEIQAANPKDNKIEGRLQLKSRQGA